MTREELGNLQPGDKIVFKRDCGNCKSEDCPSFRLNKAQENCIEGYLIFKKSGQFTIFVEEVRDGDSYRYFELYRPRGWSYERDY